MSPGDIGQGHSGGITSHLCSVLLATTALGLTIPYLLGQAVARIEAGASPGELGRRALAIAVLALGTAVVGREKGDGIKLSLA